LQVWRFRCPLPQSGWDVALVLEGDPDGEASGRARTRSWPFGARRPGTVCLQGTSRGNRFPLEVLPKSCPFRAETDVVLEDAMGAASIGPHARSTTGRGGALSVPAPRVSECGKGPRDP